jgi:hypothetical protein
MAHCQHRSSTRLDHIRAHCSDRCSVDLAGRHEYGYVPRDLGVGDGDDVQFAYCLDCGQIQRRFPLRPTLLEEVRSE